MIMKMLKTAVTLLLLAAFLAACTSTPEERKPDQDMLDRRDDAMDELDRYTQ